LRQHGATGSQAAERLLRYLKDKITEIKAKVGRYKKILDELESVITIIEGCRECSNKTEESICEKCVDTRTDHHIPPLMKSLL
jgi:recombinational DNA repair protein RecR